MNLNNNTKNSLKEFLDSRVEKYNQPEFIVNDPICIPHQFTTLQDIEIMRFWTAILAWGQRKTIINKAKEIVELMDGSPYDFIKNHKKATESDSSVLNIVLSNLPILYISSNFYTSIIKQIHL